MTLSQFLLIYRMAGMRALAAAADCKVGYLVQLAYNPAKEPSLSLAVALRDASGGLLCIDKMVRRRRLNVRRVVAEDGALCAD